MNICEKLSNIQNELKAPKGQFNKFGGYKYRSCEDILEAVKPICKKYNTTLVLSDEIVVLGESTPTVYTENYYDKDLKKENVRTIVLGNQRYYIKAIATLYNNEPDKNGAIQKIENTAYAREEESKKGMDGSQITGTASSYARKYALNGLFNIDDTKDADIDEYKKQQDRNIEDNGEQIVDKMKVDLLDQAILKNHIKDEVVEIVLSNYGYTNTSQIKNKDYKKIVDDLKESK